MISYSQYHEDVLLHRLFVNKETGFYVDVGAYHPLICSVTRAFSEKGWRGINIEPGSIFSQLVEHRPRDLNLNVAVSEEAGTITYYEYPSMPAVSRLSEDIPETLLPWSEGRVARSVPALPLRAIFKNHWPSEGVDFMSIDVEGHEAQVIRSNDWDRYRPRALVIEATLPFSSTPCHEGWEPHLLRVGYIYTYFDGLNRYYVREEDRDLAEHFRVPVNLFDGFTPAEIVDLRERLQVAKLQAQHKEGQLATVSEELKRTRGELTRTRGELTRARVELRQLQARLVGTGERALKVGLSVARFLARLKPARLFKYH